MKILIVTLEYPPQIGGIASYVYNFIRAYSTYATCVVYAPFTGNKDEFDKLNDWKVYRKQPFWKFMWPHWLRLLFQLFVLVRTERPDVIHIHQVLPGGYVAWLLKKYFKIPYVIFLHGSDVQHIKLQKHKIKRFIRVSTEATRVIVNSHFLEREVKTIIPGLSTIQVIYPSPAEQFFTPALAEEVLKLKESLALTGKKVMITVARMVPGKGHVHLARLLPQLLEKIPNLVWVIVGDGNEREELVKTISQNQLQSVVRMVGAVDPLALPTLYEAADVFVLLNEKNDTTAEGFGTVFLEAALYGLPVVAGDVGGVQEAVDQLQTGILVDPMQEEAVVSSIAEILRNPTYAREMGQRGRDRVIREFTWEKQIEKLI